MTDSTSHNWEQIIAECGELLWNTIYRMLRNYEESLDCYQDVVLEAYQRTQGVQVGNWAALLRWYGVRRSLDRLRRRSSVVEVAATQCLAAIQSDDIEPIHLALLKDAATQIRIELANLPEQQAVAFWLRAVEEMGYRDIAMQLGINVNNVGVLIHRARSRLRMSLTANEVESDLQRR